MNRAKPFCIAKREVWEAYKQVKANRGAAGIDGQSIEDFERELSNNLYRIWNRMSAGSYFPRPVRRVDIPKGDSGKTRPLGIPAVSDRIAQTVVKRYLEPILEPKFHKDSYGYRPGKSAHDALAVARQRCWRYDWVLDLDIESFFDQIDWKLLMRAVHQHTDCTWVLLYIERWLKAPVSMPDGTLVSRDRGTPQGSVISPVLANLFLHYAFDRWMQREYPDIPFERYADDAICHCRSEAQAQRLRQALAQRFADCGLQLHPQKTKVIYCKDTNRPGTYPERSFDFLGYTFRPRSSRNRDGRHFVSFLPAVSRLAAKRMRQRVRRWRLHQRNDLKLEDIATWVRPVLSGWVRYYGRFYPSKLRSELRTIDEFIVRWASRKYKRFHGRVMASWKWLRALRRRNPQLFAHWSLESAAG
jgi:RNA-directed DNA polymerase